MSFRFGVEMAGSETVDVQRVGAAVRLELHTDALTTILDMTPADAKLIGMAMVTAADVGSEGAP